MESVDRIREWVDEYGPRMSTQERYVAGIFGDVGKRKLLDIADAIEAEVAANYVTMPVRIKARQELERENSRLWNEISNVTNSRDAERAKRQKLQHRYTERVGALIDLLRDARDEYVALAETCASVDGVLPHPLDANGEVINIGDIMVTDDGETFEVSSIDWGRHPQHHEGEGWFIWSADAEYMEDPSTLTHYSGDTFERIVGDATAIGAMMGRRTTQIDDLVERCKKVARGRAYGNL